MRKIITSIYLSVFFYFIVNAQDLNDQVVRKIIDSTKKELNTAKGNKRIDCLNLLAESYFWVWDENDKHLDTACSYSEEAYNLAKNSGYKRGLGYAFLWKSHCYGGRTDNNINNNSAETNYVEAYNYANKAIQVGEEIKDYRLVGDVYNTLKWMERWRGDLQVKFKNNLEKAIYYYEKPVTKKLTGHLGISQCDQCQGNEGELGFLYIQLSGFETGPSSNKEAYIEKAINYYQKTGDNSGLGSAYLELANSANRSKDIETGIGYLKKSIYFYHKSGNERSELQAVNVLCAAYWNLGDFENGLEYTKKSILTAERLVKLRGSGDSIRLGQAYYWMGRFYSIAEDYETAFSFMRKARNFYEADSRFIEGQWRVAMGSIHNLTSNYDSAMYYLSPSLNKPGQGGKFVLSDLYISLKQYDNALKVINDAIKSQEARNDQFVLGRNYIVAAKAYLGKNDYSSALTNARMANSLLGKVKSNTYLINNYQVISDIFNKMGKYDSAYYYLKLYTVSKDSLLKKQLYIKLNNYKKEAEEAKRTGQIRLLQKDYLIKEQELREQILLKEQSETELSLLDKSNELKDQKIKEQTLLKEQQQSQLILSDKENKLKDQRLKQQAFIRNALLGGLLLFILLGVFVFRNLSLKRKNEKLAVKKGQAELQQKVSELEMQALRAQMNPHFIFNCLSSINRFIFKNDNKVASDYLTRFSRLIRMVLMHSQKKLIPLEDELEMLRLYLDLERLRFKDAFDYSITTTNIVDAGAVFIPPLLLQPFCENAVWHGLMHKESKGHLNISISEVINGNDKVLHCVIEDDGVGREKAAEMKSKSAESEKSMGLKITTERLALLNQENNFNTFYRIEDKLNGNNEVTGTRVQLKIKHKESVEEIV